MQATKQSHQKSLDVVSQATLAIRDAILTGSFLPGEQLKDRIVAEQLGFTRTTVRQALARVASEGFATAVPRVGVFVRKMTLEEQRHVFEYRIAVETGACALACHNATNEELDALESLGAETDSSYEHQLRTMAWDWNGLFESEIEFHARLIELSHNPELTKTITRPQMIFWIYNLFKSSRPEFLPLFQERRAMRVPHAEIARAIASRDVSKATGAMHGHLGHTLGSFDELLEKDDRRR